MEAEPQSPKPVPGRFWPIFCSVCLGLAWVIFLASLLSQDWLRSQYVFDENNARSDGDEMYVYSRVFGGILAALALEWLTLWLLLFTPCPPGRLEWVKAITGFLLIPSMLIHIPFACCTGCLGGL